MCVCVCLLSVLRICVWEQKVTSLDVTPGNMQHVEEEQSDEKKKKKKKRAIANVQFHTFTSPLSERNNATAALSVFSFFFNVS